MSETFELEFPFEHGGATITSVTLRRPLTGDLRKLQNSSKSAADRSLGMIGDLVEQPPAFIDKLDPVDLRKINAWLRPIIDDPAGESDASGR
jgi:hypothetical protein